MNEIRKKDLSFAKGICGENVFWKIENNTLIIYGEGEMSIKSPPWYGYRLLIKKIVIEDGVTAIGSFAFYYCENLESVYLPENLKKVGEAAFFYCNSLKRIYPPAIVKKLPKNCFKCCDTHKEIINWAASYRNPVYSKTKIKHKKLGKLLHRTNHTK